MMRVLQFKVGRYGVGVLVQRGDILHRMKFLWSDVALLAAEWLALGLTLGAVWLIGAQDVRGQWLMLLAQGAWFVVASYRRSLALAAQSVALAALTWRALWIWCGWGW